MKEQNIESLIDELLGGAREESPVETSVSKEPLEPPTRSSRPKEKVASKPKKKKRKKTFSLLL